MTENSGFQKNTPDKAVAYWLFSGCVMIAIILIVGGLTRLHGAGLSIPDWDVFGSFPPVTEEQWDEAFDKYKQFPEYQELNRGMSMGEFQWIFWWEYIHRMLARLLGLMFIIPFAIFAWQKRFSAGDYGKLSAVFALGGLQGLFGWYMVYSGLGDQPYVSHFWLAIHLGMAFLLFWMLLRFGLTKLQGFPPRAPASSLSFFTIGMIVLVYIQIIFGAFTAGLDAGYNYQTFPKMGNHWIPPEIGARADSLLEDLVTNSVSVQFIHRIIAYILFFVGIAYWYRIYKNVTIPRIRTLAHTFLALLMSQVLAGILTLLTFPTLWLSSLHQFLALVLFMVLILLEKNISMERERL